MSDIEKVLKGLEAHATASGCMKNCPYWKIDKLDCAQELAADALALLKSYQPRVLTLEEATEEDECWLECDDGPCGYADCIKLGNKTVRVSLCWRILPIILSCDEYGKKWRCWSSKPADKERVVVFKYD